MAELNRTPAPFLDLAQLCRALEATTKRNQKIAMIAEFLRRVSPKGVGLATLFLSGKAFPESDPRVLEVSYASSKPSSREPVPWKPNFSPA